MIELTSLTPARWRRSAGPRRRPGRPPRPGPTTIADAPSPKIILDVRTLPILSENFSTHTSSTGRSDLLDLPDRLGEPVGQPGTGRDHVHRRVGLQQPELAGDPAGHGGIRRLLVQVADQDRADLVGRPAGLRERRAGGVQREVLGSRDGVAALVDPGLAADLLGAHRRPREAGVADDVVVVADVLTAHHRQRLQRGPHREGLAHPHRRVRRPGRHRLDRLPRRLRDGGARIAGLFGPVDERHDIAVARVEGDDEVVVADRRRRWRSVGPRARPTGTGCAAPSPSA